jgi:phosphatidylglycerol:prolipoprotein diacylglycerol transferase
MLNLADGVALVGPIGLFFGRIANFINAELVGRPTDVPWGVIFPGEAIARHPSQLYEAILEGPLLLALLWLVYKRWRPRDGRIAALFLIFYGIFRFAIEFTREPDVQLGFIAFGWLTMGQLLSLVLLPAGALLWWIAGKVNNGFVNSQPASGRDKTGTSSA